MSNRRNIKAFFENINLTANKINLMMVTVLFLIIGLACSSEKSSFTTPVSDNPGAENLFKPRHLHSYSLRGFRFSYYLIPKNLGSEQLIAAAQEIHNSEPDAQLILVDDEARVADYIAYAQEVGRGNMQVKLPKEWADEHIIGNVQKYLSGKWMLCEGNGYREIAELK